MSRSVRRVNTRRISTTTPGEKAALVGIGIGIVLLGIFLWFVRLAIVALFVWSLVFGITDWATNGVNPWAVIWTVIGGLGVLGMVANIFKSRG